jgi:hypothetical protein
VVVVVDDVVDVDVVDDDVVDVGGFALWFLK